MRIESVVTRLDIPADVVFASAGVKFAARLVLRTRHSFPYFKYRIDFVWYRQLQQPAL